MECDGNVTDCSKTRRACKGGATECNRNSTEENGNGVGV